MLGKGEIERRKGRGGDGDDVGTDGMSFCATAEHMLGYFCLEGESTVVGAGAAFKSSSEDGEEEEQEEEAGGKEKLGWWMWW